MSETVITLFGKREGPFYFSHVRRTGTYDMTTSHYHPCYEVYYLLSGERYYFIKDQLYCIQKGDLVLIDKNEVHKTSGDDSQHERIVTNFTDSLFLHSHYDCTDLLFSPFRNGLQVIRLNSHGQMLVETLLKRVTKEVTEQEIGFEICTKQLIVELLIFANRQLKRSVTNLIESERPLHKKIREIVLYIHNHYMDEITLSLVAKTFFISPYYLSRIFKEITGFTFVEYLNITRIKEAQRLLTGSSEKIIDIAEQVGFSNITHFGRVFKKLASVTPISYRKNESIRIG
ncbi:MAG: AraC family transcriptional regulator [Bacilli bacterium]|nr:AraC family transcriptional regulator [Bacilli bacterium]